jgi:tagatose-6-phosphate ketose/aldose isomerase
VVALHESPLGFRHGPKAIVDGQTLVVILMSNDAHARRYDLDLWNELRSDGRAARVVALSAATDGALTGEFQSLRVGGRPDHPCASGTVNRVVRGVTIHPWRPAITDVPGR